MLLGDGGRFRGGGGGFGGRGPKQGARGFNRHMGNVPAVTALLSGPGFSNDEIMEVVSPGVRDIESREALVSEGNIILPGHAEWRMQSFAGGRLDDSSHVVRANHFVLNTMAVPRKSSVFNCQILFLF